MKGKACRGIHVVSRTPRVHLLTSINAQSQPQACEYPVQGKVTAEMSDQMDGDFCSTLHPILYPGYKINFKLDTALTKSGVGSSSSF